MSHTAHDSDDDATLLVSATQPRATQPLRRTQRITASILDTDPDVLPPTQPSGPAYAGDISLHSPEHVPDDTQVRWEEPYDSDCERAEAEVSMAPDPPTDVSVQEIPRTEFRAGDSTDRPDGLEDITDRTTTSDVHQTSLEDITDPTDHSIHPTSRADDSSVERVSSEIVPRHAGERSSSSRMDDTPTRSASEAPLESLPTPSLPTPSMPTPPVPDNVPASAPASKTLLRRSGTRQARRSVLLDELLGVSSEPRPSSAEYRRRWEEERQASQGASEAPTPAQSGHDTEHGASSVPTRPLTGPSVPRQRPSPSAHRAAAPRAPSPAPARDPPGDTLIAPAESELSVDPSPEWSLQRPSFVQVRFAPLVRKRAAEAPAPSPPVPQHSTPNYKKFRTRGRSAPRRVALIAPGAPDTHSTPAEDPLFLGNVSD